MASRAIDSPSQSSDDTSPERATSTIPTSTCSSGPTELVLDVIWAGDIYSYTIPTFTVVSVILKHVEVNARDGQSNFDAFMRVISEPLVIPATISIVEACYVDVSTSIATNKLE